MIHLINSLESMTGEKLTWAKSSVLSLIDSLDETHLMTLLVFDSEVEEWNYNLTFSPTGNNTFEVEATDEQHVFPCTNYTYDAVVEYFTTINSTYGTQANITNAIEMAIELDKQIISEGLIPENALSMIILLTDGRSATGNTSETVSKDIRVLNKGAKIPIFSIGIGYAANMEFLEDIAGLLQHHF